SSSSWRTFRCSLRPSPRTGGATSAENERNAAWTAGEPPAVRAPRRPERLRRRDGGPGADGAAAAGRAGVRAQLEDGHHVVHRELRGDEGGDQPDRGPGVGPHRPQADPGSRLALRPARTVHDYLRTGVVVDRPRQRATRREPGDGVVDDRHHEGRSGWTEAP